SSVKQRSQTQNLVRSRRSASSGREFTHGRERQWRVLERIAFVDSRPHNAGGVDHEGDAPMKAALLREDAVRFAGLVAGPIPKQRELQFHVLAEVVGGGEAVNTNAQHLGTGRDEVVLDLGEA